MTKKINTVAIPGKELTKVLIKKQIFKKSQFFWVIQEQYRLLKTESDLAYVLEHDAIQRIKRGLKYSKSYNYYNCVHKAYAVIATIASVFQINGVGLHINDENEHAMNLFILSNFKSYFYDHGADLVTKITRPENLTKENYFIF